VNRNRNTRDTTEPYFSMAPGTIHESNQRKLILLKKVPLCITDTPILIQVSKPHKTNNLIFPPYSLALIITVTFPQ
jgi:hypothetical protein